MIVFWLFLGKIPLIIKTSGDKGNQISWSSTSKTNFLNDKLPNFLKFDKLQWTFTWETNLALTFRRSSRWIYLPYECLLFKKICQSSTFVVIFYLCQSKDHSMFNLFQEVSWYISCGVWMMYLVMQFFSTISR